MEKKGFLGKLENEKKCQIYNAEKHGIRYLQSRNFSFVSLSVGSTINYYNGTFQNQIKMADVHWMKWRWHNNFSDLKMD